MSAAGIATLRCAASRYVVVRSDPFHRSTAPGTKFDPVAVFHPPGRWRASPTSNLVSDWWFPTPAGRTHRAKELLDRSPGLVRSPTPLEKQPGKQWQNSCRKRSGDACCSSGGEPQPHSFPGTDRGVGCTSDLGLTITGNGILKSGCSVTGPGGVQVAGDQVVYTAPVQKPPTFFPSAVALVVCSATNSAGTGYATVLLNLQFS